MTGSIISIWGAGYYHYGISALFKPIALELGLSRAVTSVPTSIGRLEGGFEAPLAGWITDRFGPRWISLFGVFLMGLGLVLTTYVDSLWGFYITWGIILGTGYNVAVTIPVDKAIADWFVKKRGKAMGVKWVGAGLSGVITLPIVAWLITLQGWRMTTFLGGIAMWLVGLPLAWFFFKRHRPEYYGLLPDGATTETESEKDTTRMIDRGIKYAEEVEEVEFTLRQAMRTPAYWLLILAYSAHSLAAPAISIHLIPFLTDIGIDPVIAAGMMVIMVSCSIPSRFIAGFLADRVKKQHLQFLMAGAYFLQAAGMITFLLNQTITMIYVWFVFYGIGLGANYTLMSPTRARYFGRKAFGSINGTSAMLSAPAGIVAPIYLGWVYDTKGSYISGFTLIAVLLAVSAVIMSFIRPPKPPARIGDVSNIV